MCDAMSAVVKRSMRLHSLKGKIIITTAIDMFREASRLLTSKSLMFIYVEKDEVQGWREKLEPRYKCVRRIPAIQNAHGILIQDDKTVHIKKFSASSEFVKFNAIKTPITPAPEHTVSDEPAPTETQASGSEAGRTSRLPILKVSRAPKRHTQQPAIQLAPQPVTQEGLRHLVPEAPQPVGREGLQPLNPQPPQAQRTPVREHQIGVFYCIQVGKTYQIGQATEFDANSETLSLRMMQKKGYAGKALKWPNNERLLQVSYAAVLSPVQAPHPVPPREFYYLHEGDLELVKELLKARSD